MISKFPLIFRCKNENFYWICSVSGLLQRIFAKQAAPVLEIVGHLAYY